MRGCYEGQDADVPTNFDESLGDGKAIAGKYEYRVVMRDLEKFNFLGFSSNVLARALRPVSKGGNLSERQWILARREGGWIDLLRISRRKSRTAKYAYELTRRNRQVTRNQGSPESVT